MTSQLESTPRKMYWSDDVRGTRLCPDCHAKLVPRPQTYLLILRHAKYTDTHLAGSDGGHFCPACPVVVLDRKQFDAYAATSSDARAGSSYLVPGLVDLSAVPEDKADLPFDELDNPLPLVMFTNLQQSPETGDPALVSGSPAPSSSWPARRQARTASSSRPSARAGCPCGPPGNSLATIVFRPANEERVAAPPHL